MKMRATASSWACSHFGSGRRAKGSYWASRHSRPRALPAVRSCQDDGADSWLQCGEEAGVVLNSSFELPRAKPMLATRLQRDLLLIEAAGRRALGPPGGARVGASGPPVW